mmetsp:Transcript_30860/g.57639  ORF Transcript_30860/g.57639 Transcript_30860/m.57639 type:complete len:169 (-) Transcript_30860:278-784(-)
MRFQQPMVVCDDSKPKKRKVKSVHWQAGLMSEQEYWMAQLCEVLNKDETVKDAMYRLHKKAQCGDAQAERFRNRVYLISKTLYSNGARYIWRTKRRLLEQLAAERTGFLRYLKQMSLESSVAMNTEEVSAELQNSNSKQAPTTSVHSPSSSPLAANAPQLTAHDRAAA